MMAGEAPAARLIGVRGWDEDRVVRTAGFGVVQISGPTSFVAAEIRHGLQSAASAAADCTATFKLRASFEREETQDKTTGCANRRKRDRRLKP
jgi:hypothetical protein